MTFRGVRVLVALAFLAALAGCTVWTNDLKRIVDQSERDYEREPYMDFKTVPMEEVIAHPSSFMLVHVRFLAVLNRKHERVFVTLYSNYRQEDYLAFSLWPLSARLWVKGDRTTSLPTIYLPKDNPDVQALLSAPRYSLVDIRGTVTNDFKNTPFIEVQYFNVLDPALYTESTLADMMEGMDAAAQNRPAEAVARLERALRGSLAEPARLIVHMRLGGVYEGRQDYENAVLHFGKILAVEPENVKAQEGAARAQAALDRLRAIEEGETPSPASP